MKEKNSRSSSEQALERKEKTVPLADGAIPLV